MSPIAEGRGGGSEIEDCPGGIAPESEAGMLLLVLLAAARHAPVEGLLLGIYENDRLATYFVTENSDCGSLTLAGEDTTAEGLEKLLGKAAPAAFERAWRLTPRSNASRPSTGGPSSGCRVPGARSLSLLPPIPGAVRHTQTPRGEWTAQSLENQPSRDRVSTCRAGLFQPDNE